MTNRQRLVAEFLDLVQIDSLSKREGPIAERLAATLAGMGVTVEMDGVRGETRSRSLAKLEEQTQHMRRCFEEAAARHRAVAGGREHVARVEAKIARDYDRLDLPDAAPIVKLVKRAVANLGKPLRTRATGGGCDANVLNGRGLAIANLGCGMREIHTVNEWIDVQDILATAELLVETVRLNATG